MIIISHNDSYLYDDHGFLKYEGKLEDIAWGLYEKYGSYLRKDDTTCTSLRVNDSIIIIKNHYLNQQFLSYSNRYQGSPIPYFFDSLNKEYEKIYLRFTKLKTFW